MNKLKKHGMSGSREYKSWEMMIQRCTNENNSNYKYYGGRGITVCERWKKFENFYEDMGDRPVNMSLDRIDNDKGYLKENCKWSNQSEQNINRRRIGNYKNNTSGFRGVRFYARLNKWVATVSINGKRKHLGYFPDIEQAVSARERVLSS